MLSNLFNLTGFGTHPREGKSKVTNRALTLILFPDRLDISAIRRK